MEVFSYSLSDIIVQELNYRPQLAPQFGHLRDINFMLKIEFTHVPHIIVQFFLFLLIMQVNKFGWL